MIASAMLTAFFIGLTGPRSLSPFIVSWISISMNENEKANRMLPTALRSFQTEAGCPMSDPSGGRGA